MGKEINSPRDGTELILLKVLDILKQESISDYLFYVQTCSCIEGLFQQYTLK